MNGCCKVTLHHKSFMHSLAHLGILQSGSSQIVRTLRIPSNYSTEFPYQITSDALNVYTTYAFSNTPNAITGNAAYVNLEAVTNGTGTAISPFNTMSTAVAGAFNIFYVTGKGRITRSTFSITKNMKILQWPGFDMPEFTRQVDNDLVWTANATFPNVYEAVNPSAPTFINTVMDRNNIDSNGCYVGLNARASISAVNSNPGSFWYDSTAGITKLYVRTFDSRIPDNTTIVPLLGNGTVISISGNISATKYVYMENCRVFGGGTCLTLTNTGTASVEYGFYNCHFNHAGGTEAAFYINGRANGYTRECMSFYNRDDAFDYNSALTGFAFEWKCKSGKGVWTTGTGNAVNASTGHQNHKIIRVAGDYSLTWGKTVQDIDNVFAFNYRCNAGGSYAAAPNKEAYATGNTGGKTWLIECTRTVPESLRNFAGCTCDVYDGTIGNILTGTIVNSGTLNTLTLGDVYV
jgi:hypothetical protein